jgi:uncharacterized membrane protein YeaQ/YmgE (transglycosylase-associated protein family)
MDSIDVLIWLLAGLSAGGLAGAIWPHAARTARCAALLAGVLGALAGGWMVDSLAGMSAISFLGAVCAGVLCALLSSVLVRRFIHGWGSEPFPRTAG